MEEIKITAINKIKINPDKTAVICFSQSDDLTSAEITFKGKDRITSKFDEKFQENIEGLVATMPLLRTGKDGLTMSIIKFDYDKESKTIDNVSYAAKYLMNCDGDCADIVTPLLPMYEKEEQHKQLLHDVVRLAKAYVNGETSINQMKIFK